MTVQEPTKYYPSPDHSNLNIPAYHYDDTLSSAINGEWLLLPAGIAHVSVILEVTAGEGKVQVTNDYVGVRAGSANGVIDWDDGAVTETTQSQVAPVVAIRQVNVSGTTKMFIQAQ